MKKILRCIVLISFIFLLSGCGWDDVVKEHGDVLKTNPYCSYKTNDAGLSGETGFTSVILSADMNSFYAQYDGTSKVDLVKEGSHWRNNVLINYSSFDERTLNQFFDSYKSYGCPSVIYVCKSPGSGVGVMLTSSGDDCYEYAKTGGSSINSNSTSGGKVQSDPTKTCANSNAKNCEQTYFKDERGNNISIEVGKEQSSNGSTNNYFIISYDNFKTAPINRNDTYKASNGDIFVVSNTVFELENGKYGKIPVKYSLEGTTGYYYLGQHDDKVGVDSGFTVIENPNNNVGDQTNVGGYEIDPIDYCTNTGILKTLRIVGYAFFVLKILVPLILIVMATIDFAKAVISSDDKSNKDAMNKLIRRVIIGVIIFLIPSVLDFGFSVVDEAVDNMKTFEQCSTCLFDPMNCNP